MAVAKAFELPPMRGNRIMVMSPAGGFAVIGADLCEKAGFEFAHPGEEFYKSLSKFANAGVIKFSNPLDMGDIYNPHMVAHVTYEVMHNDNVDGAIYIGQKPKMPEGDNVFRDMFLTDLSKELYGCYPFIRKTSWGMSLWTFRVPAYGKGIFELSDIQ